jgi:CubicO group peptidase (beta-lactamase class C family)
MEERIDAKANLVKFCQLIKISLGGEVMYLKKNVSLFSLPRLFRFFIGVCAAVSLSLPCLATAQPSSPWTTPTMIEGRNQMFFPGLNFLTFQHMDQMFASRVVKASIQPWVLPKEQTNFEVSYTYDGKTYGLDQFLEKTSTNALLVINNQRIVAEIYRNGSNEESRFISFSMAKSITSTLIGIALSEKKIESIDDPVTKYLPEMVGSGYQGVTIKQLLMMRSGIDWLEIYRFKDPTQLTEVHDNSLVAYKYRWCDYAANQSKGKNPPGTVFNYSTLDTSVLGCLLERVVGMKGADYTTEKLWKPAGMERDGYWILDGPPEVGREFYGAGFNATLRDYGRFGLMFLNNGIAGGKQVIPSEWVKQATGGLHEPTGPDKPTGYQYLWWTIPNSRAFMAVGLHHQFIYIDPDTRTVIVKLSATPKPVGDQPEHLAFFRAVVARFAKTQ